jgi:hypothetical protein
LPGADGKTRDTEKYLVFYLPYMLTLWSLSGCKGAAEVFPTLTIVFPMLDRFKAPFLKNLGLKELTNLNRTNYKHNQRFVHRYPKKKTTQLTPKTSICSKLGRVGADFLAYIPTQTLQQTNPKADHTRGPVKPDIHCVHFNGLRVVFVVPPLDPPTPDSKVVAIKL